MIASFSSTAIVHVEYTMIPPVFDSVTHRSMQHIQQYGHIRLSPEEPSFLETVA